MVVGLSDKAAHRNSRWACDLEGIALTVPDSFWGKIVISNLHALLYKVYQFFC